ncbi:MULTISPECIES: hypothetical protein [unclassified Bacillus (in: firmicutes)]|uniref:hypothetical protein n=1 Tax=unclassified Bacillus (in: firmicutes) TaxID=185979 RepID=UPI001F5B9FBA|nr:MULTISPECIES: hypothetical protein [unclassified Bacillus (in: firmicutes)]
MNLKYKNGFYVREDIYGETVLVSQNNLAVVCFGEKVDIEFEKLNQNRIIEYVMGNCFVPKITLVPSSACAFIQYDGAVLTIVSNNLEI